VDVLGLAGQEGQAVITVIEALWAAPFIKILVVLIVGAIVTTAVHERRN
jgi:hypothetical protein